MDKILTLAIPAYNMEQYLSRCLDSVLLPEIENDVEVLVLNDGSKDNTLAIARQYEAKYCNLRVIDKPNGGWGSAINRAVKEANGIYFKILDSDDWFDSDAFIKYISFLKKAGTDLVVTAYTHVYIEGGECKFEYDAEICDKGIIGFNDYIKHNKFMHGLNLSNATLRTSLLTGDVADRYYADIEYVMKPLADVKTIRFSNVNLYRYYIGREGQSTSVSGYNAHFNDFIVMLYKLINYYESKKMSLSDAVKRMYEIDFSRLVTFGYYLHMSPTYGGGSVERTSKLKRFNDDLKKASPRLYTLVRRAKVKKFIPYIFLWRLTGINILKLRSWI